MASWSLPQGDVLTTKYQVDLGDGFKAVYVNLTSTEEPIRHRYESPGVYRVSVRAENVAGHDEAVLFVQVNCKSVAPLRPRVPPRGRGPRVLGGMQGDPRACSRTPVLRMAGRGAGRRADWAQVHTPGAPCHGGFGDDAGGSDEGDGDSAQ